MGKTGKWSKDEDLLLKNAVDQLGAKQWRQIAELVPGRTSIQCLHRWTKILKPGLVKGSWTQEEDLKLRKWVQTNKSNLKWADATKIIPGRSGKQIRERWFNILNPNINKTKWTENEERLLFRLYQNIGPKWCALVEHFESRTENFIKNRFYSTLRRVATEHKRKIQKKIKQLEDQTEIAILSNDELYIENPQVAKTETLLKFLPLVHEILGTGQEEVKLNAKISLKKTKNRPMGCYKIKQKNPGLQKQNKKPKTMKRKIQIETSNSAFEKREVKRVKTEENSEVPLINVSKFDTSQVDASKRIDVNFEQYENKFANSNVNMNEVNFTPSTMNMENQFVDFRNIFNQQLTHQEFNPAQFSHEFGMDSFSYNPSVNLNTDDKGNNFGSWSYYKAKIIYYRVRKSREQASNRV